MAKCTSISDVLIPYINAIKPLVSGTLIEPRDNQIKKHTFELYDNGFDHISYKFTSNKKEITQYYDAEIYNIIVFIYNILQNPTKQIENKQIFKEIFKHFTHKSLDNKNQLKLILTSKVYFTAFYESINTQDTDLEISDMIVQATRILVHITIIYCKKI